MQKKGLWITYIDSGDREFVFPENIESIELKEVLVDEKCPQTI